MSLSCVAGSPAGGCKSQAPVVELREELGRRIYIHEDSLTALAAQGREEALHVFRMAARTVALKAVHHVHQDAAMLGMSTSEGAVLLKEAITLAWSGNASHTLRRFGYRPNEPRLRDHIVQILGENEDIVASCYFSNYYTFATGAKSAEWMFDDTNDIATLRRLMQETDQYRDLSLINGHCLVLIDAEIGAGEGKARTYVQALRARATLSSDALSRIKSEVYLETKRDLELMLSASLNLLDLGEKRIASDVLQALDYAFSKGILKSSVLPVSAGAC